MTDCQRFEEVGRNITKIHNFNHIIIIKIMMVLVVMKMVTTMVSICICKIIMNNISNKILYLVDVT